MKALIHDAGHRLYEFLNLVTARPRNLGPVEHEARSASGFFHRVQGELEIPEVHENANANRWKGRRQDFLSAEPFAKLKPIPLRI